MQFTVITINYNNCEGLRQTLESVVRQTYDDFELVVIDGGSDDGSRDVILDFSNEIAYWVSEKDRGIYHAMNKGVFQAHGNYCLFMNSGDCFYNNRVLGRVAALNCQEDILVGKVVAGENDFFMSPPPEREISLYHLYSGAIPHQGAFINTALLRKNPYDENLRISADWKFFLQTIIMDNCSFKYIDELVARYDMNGISTSNPKQMRQEKEQILAEMLPPRILADYRHMKDSECLTQTLTPKLRISYRIDKILYKLGKILLMIKKKY